MRGREVPGPDQESVWDYPRPPRLEVVRVPIRVELFGKTIVNTEEAIRVLETSHPPVYYVALSCLQEGLLRPSQSRPTFCEFKGVAHYWDAVWEEEICREVGWTYRDPVPEYASLRDFIAFYPSRVQSCYVNGERVTPQAGDFYGGWITRQVVGPFKGGPGTLGW